MDYGTGDRSGGRRMIVSQANGSNYTIKNEVEMIDENLTININKGMPVPEIDQFKSNLPKKEQMKGDCVVDDYKDSSSPVRVMVRVFDGDLSQSKEEAYEKHLKKQMKRNHFRRDTSNNVNLLAAHGKK